MNQANVDKLVSKLRFKINPQRRKLQNVDGPEGRLRKIQKTLTALIKYERLELNFPRADETRGYVEQVCTTCYLCNLEHILILIIFCNSHIANSTDRDFIIAFFCS